MEFFRRTECVALSTVEHQLKKMLDVEKLVHENLLLAVFFFRFSHTRKSLSRETHTAVICIHFPFACKSYGDVILA